MPLHRVGAVPEEVGQLQGLLDLFEKHLDLPTAAIQVGDAARASSLVVGQENHITLFSVHLNLGSDQVQCRRGQAVNRQLILSE